MEKKNIYILLLLALTLSACGGYNSILKSTNNELKYSKALEYYEKGEFYKSASLLEAVIPSYRGTEKGEEGLYLLGMSYLKNKDYAYAKSYFSAYYKGYPKGKHAEEAKYYVGYCYYLDSPNVRLDQTNTVSAIDELLAFADAFPKSDKLKSVYEMLKELQEKMAEKAYLNAKLYYDLGDYMGNNYLSAVVTATNALKLYPNSKFKEDLSFLILKSKYMQAEKSVEEKKEERYRDTVDEYFSFKNEFPSGKYVSEAEHIYKKSQKHLE